MRSKKLVLIVFFVIVSLFTLSILWVRAQVDDPPRESLNPDTPELSSNFIPVQGRLADGSGNPLSGIFDVTFRLYDVYTGGVPLCEQTRSRTVEDGLYSTYFSGVGCSIDGRQLYLGIEVEGDGEMTPRQYIDNVLIAWTLRPGALISSTMDSSAILNIENWGANGRGLRAYESTLGFWHKIWSAWEVF